MHSVYSIATVYTIYLHIMYIKTNDIVKTDDEPSSSLCTGQGDISDQMRSHNTDSSPQMAQSTPYTISRALAPVNLIKSHKFS